MLSPDTGRRVRRAALLFSGPGMLAAGTLHFVRPATYEAVIPDYLPAHRELVYASGVAEVVGGALASVPATRRAGGWLLLATLVGVTPVHVHMIVHRDRYPRIPLWLLWARLPLQGVLLRGVWLATLRRT